MSQVSNRSPLKNESPLGPHFDQFRSSLYVGAVHRSLRLSLLRYSIFINLFSFTTLHKTFQECFLGVLMIGHGHSHGPSLGLLFDNPRSPFCKLGVRDAYPYQNGWILGKVIWGPPLLLPGEGGRPVNAYGLYQLPQLMWIGDFR